MKWIKRFFNFFLGRQGVNAERMQTITVEILDVLDLYGMDHGKYALKIIEDRNRKYAIPGYVVREDSLSKRRMLVIQMLRAQGIIPEQVYQHLLGDNEHRRRVLSWMRAQPIPAEEV